MTENLSTSSTEANLLSCPPPGGRTLYLTVFNRTTAKNNNRDKYKGKIMQMRLCPPWYCGAEAVKIENENKHLFHLRCGSNYCPKCFEINKWILEHKLFKIIHLNKLNHFLTLTLDPKKIPIEYKYNTHKYITKLLHGLISGIRYYYNDLKYIWVSEFQSLGNAHLHLVVDRYIPIKKLRSRWLKLGGGSSILIENIISESGISFYISKYLSKYEDTNRFYYLERRWGCSKNCQRGGGYKSW